MGTVVSGKGCVGVEVVEGICCSREEIGLRWE